MPRELLKAILVSSQKKQKKQKTKKNNKKETGYA